MCRVRRGKTADSTNTHKQNQKRASTMAAIIFVGGVMTATLGAFAAIGVAAWKAARCPEGWFHEWHDSDPSTPEIREYSGRLEITGAHYTSHRMQSCSKCSAERKYYLYDSEPSSVDIDYSIYMPEDTD